MGSATFRHETNFVRACARDYWTEVGLTPTAEAEMAELSVYWPGVHQALCNCRVVWSDKEDAEDARSVVIGTDCDGERLRLTLLWSASTYRILVVSVERI